MDVLFSLDRRAFRSLATHVALYEERPSTEGTSICERAAVSVGAPPTKFSYSNVPGFGDLLGKSVPIDVHGRHVFLDEEAIRSKRIPASVAQYYVMAGMLKASAGGRRRYDFRVLNGCLALGVLSGGAFLHVGRRRWSWMTTRPYWRIFAATGVCVATAFAAKVFTRGLGFGAISAQRHFTKAIDAFQCESCVDEVHEFTTHQLDDVAHFVPPKGPMGEDLPSEVQESLRRGNEVFATVLAMNRSEMKKAKQVCAGRYCDRHSHK